MKLSKKIFITLSFLLLVFAFLFFSLKKPKEIKASPGSGNNVWGWAWANKLDGTTEAASGWISFNCYNDYNNDGIPESHCPPNYGAHICQSDTDTNCSGLSAPRTGKIIGYAWFGGGQDAAGNATATLGWLSFNRSETGSPPGPPFNGSEDFIAKVDNVSSSICDIEGGGANGFLDTWCGGDNLTTPVGNYKQVFGWARFLAACPAENGNDPNNPYDDPCLAGENVGGWDGWIKFSDGGTQKYGTVIDMSTDPKQFRGWAWGGGGTASSSAVVGWISFNCSNQGCGTSNYKVLTSLVIDTPPYIVPGSTSTSPAIGCGVEAGKIRYFFEWQYNDDQSDPETQFDFKILDSSENIAFSKSVTDGWSGPPTHNSVTVLIPGDGTLSFGNTYKWYAKVYNAKDSSDWVYGGSFTTPPHAYPYPQFTVQPSKPSVGEIVTFIDNSICYDASNNPYPCATTTPPGGPHITYSWDFGNGETSSYKGNATTTYTAVGIYTVTLTITDATISDSCSTSTSITLTLPLPKWKEIKP
jgi:hypothetical protein